MDPAEMMVPVFGIAAAAAVTFYTISFMQMSDKSFEDLEDRDLDAPVLRSSQSNKEKRKIRKQVKEKQPK